MVEIRLATEADFPALLRMRCALYTDATVAEPERETLESLRGPEDEVFVAVGPDGTPIGFLETRIRHVAEGCASDRVGYLEGWYVDADHRRQGIGARLVRAAEDWARAHGCREMASDCVLSNDVSLAAHLRIGYREEVRLIHFVKNLR